MAVFSHSLFLQALGWATLNSFWQMAVLWLLFVAAQHFTHLSSNSKYKLALGSLGAGVAWFIFTFAAYYNSGTQGTLPATVHQLAPNSDTWSIILTSASITYLSLLFFPAYRLVSNWRYINRLKKEGLYKTGLDYRLFVKKVAFRLGIQKGVQVFFSSLVSSPVTIGFIKPMILLPVAALNNLTVQQVEAILLHELSHIRRSDFLINLIINVIHTLFYYNPFIKFFVTAIDAEREKCCDETVLQFGYDKVSYASALLTLEKNATSAQALAIGAAGKKHLLKRIEKIVGMEKKTSFSFTQFAGIMATLLLVILVNSVLFVGKPAEKNKDLSLVAFENPFYATDRGDRILTIPTQSKEQVTNLPLPLMAKSKSATKKVDKHAVIIDVVPTQEVVMNHPVATTQLPFMAVSYNLAEQNTTAEEKLQVAKAVQATKKVLTKSQWQEVEKEIADGMTAVEKERARLEYMAELEKVDWKGLEEKLKQQYKEMDWAKINMNLSSAMVAMELDSLQHVYSSVLNEIEKAENCKKLNNAKAVLPIPDVSQAEIKALKQQLKSRVDSIKVLRNKEVISL